MRTRSTRPRGLLLALLILGGCNSDPLNGSDPGSSGSGTLSDFRITDPQDESVRAWKAPAKVRFTLATQDPDGSASVTLTFSRDGGATFQPVTTDEGAEVSNVLSNLASGEYAVDWVFSDPRDVGTERYREGIIVRAEVTDGDAVERTIALGNDAPAVVSVETPSLEVKGDADLGFTVADVSGDRLSLRVEFNQMAEENFPDTAWERARPVGLDSTADTPEFALTDLVPTGGDPLAGTFLWDSDFDPAGQDAVSPQLDSLEAVVKVRFTAVDEFGVESAVVQTAAFRVDNNEPPSLSLDGDFLVDGIKDRGNIPLSFTVTDEDSEEVQIAVQWKTGTGSFPLVRNGAGQEVELGSLTPAELRDLLENPARRQDRLDGQIALEDPLVYEGRLGTLDGLEENQVRLPELASSQAGLVAQGLVGRELELIRPARAAQPEFGLDKLPLDGISEARGAFVTEEGRSALLLHAAEGGTWRISEVDFGDVSMKREVATGSGTPRCLAADPRGEFLFVGTDQDVFRVNRFTGEVSARVSHELFLGPRGLAALGADVVLVTGDDKLRRLDFGSEFEPSNVILMEGLAQPWGVVRDPLRASGIYLAESSASNGVGEVPGRVWAVDLDQLVLESLAAEVYEEDLNLLGSVPFPNVKALALERYGSRLLAMTARNGRKELRSLALRRGPLVNRDGPPVRDEGVVEDVIGSVATGRGGIRVVAPWSVDSIGVSKVAKAVRSIVEYDPSTQVVTLDAPLPMEDPSSAEVFLWRILARSRAVGAAGGRSVSYVWNTSTLPDPSSVTLRAIAADAYHLSSEASDSKVFRNEWAANRIDLDVGAGSPQSVAAADLDGDGDMDLVSANVDRDELTLFFQTEPGTYQTGGSLSTGMDSAPRSVAAADLDGDGDMDLVSANEGDNNLTVFGYRPENSDYDEIATLDTGANPRSVAVADLDGDGDMDLVSANEGDDNLTVFFQEEPGMFTPAAAPLPAGADPASVAAADLDGDGDMDLVSANAGSHNLTLFFQTAPGSFQTFGSLSTGMESAPRSVAAADLDGDGDMDLVSANFSSDNLTLFFQTATGTFFPAAAPLPAGDGPFSVAAADLDGDGDMDLVSANLNSNNLTLFFQASPRTFTPADAPLSVPPGGFPRSVAAADLDGDGDMDLVSANVVSDNLSLFLHSSPGTFTPAADPLSAGAFPGSVAAADLDGDGDMDLVSANSPSDNLTLFFQTATGTFDPAAAPLPAGDGPQSVAAADLDGDGDMDLVSANFFGDNLTLFFQTAPGTFTPAAAPLPAGDGPRSVAAADLDGDGDMDLVSANSDDRTLTLFFQTSPGTLTQEEETLSTGKESAPSSVAAADLDGDGDMDLVSANAGSHNLTLFFQKEPGTFQTGGSLSTGTNPRSVAVADLDGDGDMDLVSANSSTSSNSLTLFFQTEPGTFQTGGSLSTGISSSPISVAAADLDGDGDMDLVSANLLTANLTLFFQTAPGTFTPATAPLPAGVNPQSVAAADLDGDGDMDLVSANLLTANLTLFFNGN